MKKFIPFIIVLLVLTSCSKDDDMLVDITKEEESKTLIINTRLDNSKLGSADSSFMMRDSIIVNDAQYKDSIIVNNVQQDSQEEDPPVKNGNHWRYSN